MKLFVKEILLFVRVSASNYNSVEWSTSGTGSFSSTSILNPEYTPGNDDIANGSVILTLTVNAPGETITDDMLLEFSPAPEINMAGDAEICANADFTDRQYYCGE